LSKGDVSTASHIQLKNISDGSGTNILTSSTDTQVSKDGPLSMFSKYFIEGIQSGDADRDVDGVITLHDLFTYTSENMRASSTQKPTYFDTGSTAGIVISASGKTSLSEMRKKIREKLKEYWSREDISDSLFSFLMRRFDKESNYSDVTKNRIDALCNSFLSGELSFGSFQEDLAIERKLWNETETRPDPSLRPGPSPRPGPSQSFNEIEQNPVTQPDRPTTPPVTPPVVGRLKAVVVGVGAVALVGVTAIAIWERGGSSPTRPTPAPLSSREPVVESRMPGEQTLRQPAVVGSPVEQAPRPPVVAVSPITVEQTPSTPAGKNWVMAAGNYANHRFSPLKQITTDNVGKLQPTWQFSTGVLRGHEGGPLVIGDVMYVHGPFPNPVYALDLKNESKILWKYAPKQDPTVIPVMCCDTVNRGLAYADGKIFLHQADTTLVALDAKDGKVVWQMKNGDPSKGETGTSAPMVIKDKVLIGISGGEFGVRCHMTAYDLKTGRRVWRGYSVGPDDQLLVDPTKTTELGKPIGKDSSLKTWQGDQWKIGGGCTWGWISYDPQLDLLYYGSGNPSTWNPKQRPGDNKWSTTIWARNPDTGMARWVYQMTPHDEWEYEGVNEMILADQVIGGANRRILVHFDRNGFGYALDRANGELLVAEKYEPTVNWATKVDMDKNSKTYGRPLVVPQYSPEQNGEDVNSKGICPSSMGAKNQQPAAFSPDTGLFYVPTTQLCMDYEPFRVSYTAGQPYVGATLSMYPPPGKTNTGSFIAWDARTGKIVWSNKEQFAVWSGALATAGGVVFYGTLEGYLKAVDAKTGRELFRLKTVSGIVGNVMTYEHGGKQYVAVLSGVGGWPGLGLAAGLTDPTAGLGAVGAFAALRNYTSLGGQLTVFALP
jgi:lanthanide-dependent methanol dehydrogenase